VRARSHASSSADRRVTGSSISGGRRARDNRRRGCPAEIIGYAYDYEQETMHRMQPRLRAARRLRECPDLPGGRCAK
jgi:hypothetical protein